MDRNVWRTLGHLGVVAGIVCVLVCGLTGCSKDGNPRDAMTLLKEGKARGHLTLAVGGSPLTAGMKQSFFLGPENMAVSFDGEIDFATSLLRDMGTNG